MKTHTKPRIGYTYQNRHNAHVTIIGTAKITGRTGQKFFVGYRHETASYHVFTIGGRQLDKPCGTGFVLRLDTATRHPHALK